MKKLNLILPMGGRGARFTSQGFREPKPLIHIYGKPFFYWATRSVEKFVELQSLTFVVLQEHIDGFSIDLRIKEYFPQARIVVIPQILPGAVMTCLAATEDWAFDGPLLFNDCDHLFLCHSFYDFCAEEGAQDVDGALLTFLSSDSRFSYAQCDDNGYVVRTEEKRVVSANAICGAYWFQNAEIFKKAAEIYLQVCDYGEFFMSGVYNVLAREKGKIRMFSVDSHVSFGTPEEYETAQKDGTYRLLL